MSYPIAAYPTNKRTFIVSLHNPLTDDDATIVVECEAATFAYDKAERIAAQDPQLVGYWVAHHVREDTPKE